MGHEKDGQNGQVVSIIYFLMTIGCLILAISTDGLKWLGGGQGSTPSAKIVRSRSLPLRPGPLCLEHLSKLDRLRDR